MQKNLLRFPGPLSLTLAVMLIAAMAFSTYRLVHAGSVGAFAGVVLSCTAMLAHLLATGLGELGATLKQLLQASASTSTRETTTNVAPPLTHRQHLELGVAVDVMRSAITLGGDGARAGKIARTALDALTGAGEQKVAEPLAASAPKSGELAMPGPSVRAEHIAEMMARVEYRFDQPSATTSTFAHAFLDGKFYLDTGHSACVSPENFNRATGEKYALAQAETKARDKLWLLEGYLLRDKLNT